MASATFAQITRGETKSWTSNHEGIKFNALSTTPEVPPGEKIKPWIIDHIFLIFQFLV